MIDTINDRVAEELRVLLVEDNPDHAQLEREALLEVYPDAIIDTVDTRAGCLERLKSAVYTIIFLDYHIRGGNGLTVLQDIQRVQPEIPVVMVTAMGKQQLAVRALREGASDYLFKTSDFFAHLPRLVETNLERHRLRRERDQLLGRTQEAAARTALINEIAKAVRSSLDLNEVLQTLTEKLGATLGVSRCLVLQFLSDPARVPAVHEYSTVNSATGPLHKAQEHRYLQRNHLMRLALETRAIVSSADLLADDRVSPAQAAAYDARAIVFSPIILAGQPLGMLVLHQCEKAREWLPSELELVRELTDQVAVAMRQAQLFDEISRAKKLWEKTFDSMTDAVTVHDITGKINRLNSAAMALHRSTYTEMMGRDCCELAFPISHSVEECLLQKAIRTGQRQSVELGDPDRRNFYVSINPVIESGAEGNDTVVAAVMLVQDVTEQRKLQEQLLRSKKMRALGEMASSVAHDFNNILAVILGRAQLLQNRAESDEILKRGLEIIVTSARDGGRTVKRIQDFARVRTDHDFGPVDFAQLLREISEITAPRWRDEAQLMGRHIKFDLDVPETLTVLGDAAELREVFVNLIFNAIDAMPEGGSLSLSLANENNRAIARVGDTGLGIPEDIRERIFDPFFTTKGLSGMGLGLSISYSIISRHGGAIEVESRQGHGTAFTVSMATFAASATNGDSIWPRPVRPARVLVVDDEPEMRQLLQDILASGGHRVTIAEDGMAAVSLFNTQPFDLVLTDLGMPGMSGWEVAEAIKLRQPKIPVGLITGWAGVMENTDLEKRGIDMIINKPFDMVQILNLVADLVPLRISRGSDL